MDNLLYDALCRYVHLMKVRGYVSYPDMVRLLILTFFIDYARNDFRGNITNSDYRLIEKAMSCLYRSTCLIPYPDYLRMSGLYLGEITEMSQRIENLEDTKVVKLMDIIPDDPDSNSDVMVYLEDDND